MLLLLAQCGTEWSGIFSSGACWEGYFSSLSLELRKPIPNQRIPVFKFFIKSLFSLFFTGFKNWTLWLQGDHEWVISHHLGLKCLHLGWKVGEIRRYTRQGIGTGKSYVSEVEKYEMYGEAQAKPPILNIFTLVEFLDYNWKFCIHIFLSAAHSATIT